MIAQKFAEVNELILIPAKEFENESLDSLADWINQGHAQIKFAVRRLAIHVAQVGSWIVAAKNKCEHGEFLIWLEENCSEISTRTAQKYMAVYSIAIVSTKTNLNSYLESVTPTEAYKALGIVKENVHFLSESVEWCTPELIIRKTILLFGSIDLDPCSDNDKNVPASNHFMLNDDGLSKDWFGKVYMNPPYGNIIGEWTRKLRIEYENGNVEEAIALVPSRTDTEWFKDMKEYQRCFIWGRLKFKHENCENSAPFPSMIVYFGDRISLFKEIFGDIGHIYRRS